MCPVGTIVVLTKNIVAPITNNTAITTATIFVPMLSYIISILLFIIF